MYSWLTQQTSTSYSTWEEAKKFSVQSLLPGLQLSLRGFHFFADGDRTLIAPKSEITIENTSEEPNGEINGEINGKGWPIMTEN